jgi:hypothetical protein
MAARWRLRHTGELIRFQLRCRFKKLLFFVFTHLKVSYDERAVENEFPGIFTGTRIYLAVQFLRLLG